MTQTTDILAVPEYIERVPPAYSCPAILRCCDAFDIAYEDSEATGGGPVLPLLEAGRAYCAAMPPLTGYKNIRDFIACAAHGMLIAAIDGATAPRLLYAAQVALTVLNSTPKKAKKGTKRAQKVPLSSPDTEE